NFPVLTSATRQGGGVQIVGSLTQSASPMTTFRVEFFSSSPDPLGGAAEGQTFIGATSVTTDGSGVGSFSAIFNVAVPSENVITATATNTTADPSSPADSVNLFNTSEFSVAIPVRFTLTVAKAGTGSGTVTSADGGIICGATCSAAYVSGTMVTLAAIPAAGSVFRGLSGGGCVGAEPCPLAL